MEESCKRLVIEDDMGVFTEFISFIYKQSFDLSSVPDFQLWDLLYLANKYLISKLIRILEQTLKTRIKECNNKADLVNHLQRANEMSIGDKFHELIKNEIEVHAESVLSSQQFLKSRNEEAKEIVKYENLHLTEGQIFKHAAEWCLQNNPTEKEAEKVFEAEFLEQISYENMTSEDFIQNVLPNSDILEREKVKKVTKQSFENKSVGMVTRYVLNPIKTIVQNIIGNDVVDNCTSIHNFEHFDMKLETSYNTQEHKGLVCNMTFIPKNESDHNAYVHFTIHSSDREIKRETLRFCSLFRTKTIIQDLNQTDSDIMIRMVIETKRFVELKVIRQDQLVTDGYKTGTFTSHFTSIRLESSITMKEATERMREKFQVKHAKLFFSLCSSNAMGFVSTYDKEIGFFDFLFSYHKSIEKCKYFLAISTNPFDNSSFDLMNDTHCLIYVQKKDSVVFVKDKIINQKDLKDEQFPRLIKYAAGMEQEEDYEVLFGDIKKSNQEWKIDWIKQEKTLGELVFCLVRPKHQE